MTDFPNTFDWVSEDNIVLRDQPAVAIYSNRFQQVVIRCERAWDQEDDVVVLVDFGSLMRSSWRPARTIFSSTGRRGEATKTSKSSCLQIGILKSTMPSSF